MAIRNKKTEVELLLVTLSEMALKARYLIVELNAEKRRSPQQCQHIDSGDTVGARRSVGNSTFPIQAQGSTDFAGRGHAAVFVRFVKVKFRETFSIANGNMSCLRIWNQKFSLGRTV
jgi:hypothetical protein